MAATARSINRQQKAAPIPIPAPVGGWNTRDSLDAMDPSDAVQLDNWFPFFGSVRSRAGSAVYATGLGGTVKMLAELNGGTFRKFIAGANGRIWDVSVAGAGASLALGFTNDAWEWAQFNDASGGIRMGLVNGADAPQIYNGTAVSAMTISGSGLTPANLNGIFIYKSRSFFWDDRTMDFWYSATNALGGTMSKFPLGRVHGVGGNLMAIQSCSADAGDGSNEYICFILTSGDVLIYQGDDPSSPNSWALVGRYNIGAPLGKRAVKKIGADLIIAMKTGYISLAEIIQHGRFNEEQSSISNKITGEAGRTATKYSANFGWDMVHYPVGSWLLVNVPYSTTQFVQHVQNTETNAWCRFTGMNGVCWALYKDSLYFGTTAGTVVLADTGASDQGAPIVFVAQPAWNFLGDLKRIKRATAIRPFLRVSGGSTSYGLGTAFDFANIFVTINQTTPAITGSAWDTSPWDTTPWADDFITSAKWSSVKGSGYAFGMLFTITTSTATIDWYASTVLVEGGGVL